MANNKLKILVTGGAGFIGSNLAHYLIEKTNHSICVIDKLSYSGNVDNLESISSNSRFNFIKVDIADTNTVRTVFKKFMPDAVMHLAAESHVDRSIESPIDFINTNILGTFSLLEVAREYIQKSGKSFKFLHVSTDEVFGDLKNSSELFDEDTAYNPSSPYSASKASSDHLVRAWFKTYRLPVLITNCSNNYGPFCFPEKFIPHLIINALKRNKMPIYGDGSNIRDWLYVEDHVKALCAVLENGVPGETYTIGGLNQKTNLELAYLICNILDRIFSQSNEKEFRYSDLITFVKDRPGHDIKYGIDASKIQSKLNWKPKENLDSGLEKTVRWYIDNQDWWEKILQKKYTLERIGEIK